MPQNFDNALRLIEKAEKCKADFIEVRLDCLNEFKGLENVAQCAKTPLIATVRTQKCGGKFLGKEKERRKILFNAASSGFKYADIELDAPWLKDLVKELLTIGVKPIISFHDFEKTPEIAELRQILKSEIEGGADICKIVTTARSLRDNLTLLYFLHKESGKAKVVCFAMGTLGKPSRFLSPIFGGYFTIAALERGMETAEGQMTIQEMKVVYKALGVI